MHLYTFDQNHAVKFKVRLVQICAIITSTVSTEIAFQVRDDKDLRMDGLTDKDRTALVDLIQLRFIPLSKGK